MTLTEKWMLTFVLLAVAFVFGALGVVGIVTSVEKANLHSERQAVCNEISVYYLFDEGTVEQTPYGCLMTWPDGSTHLVDYEAYK